MPVVQQIIPDKPFIISLIQFLFQSRKGILCLHMNQRLAVIIKPTVQRLQPKNQPFGIAAEIRFPIFKFKIVQPCCQSLPVNPFLCLFLQRSFYQTDKLFFLALFRPLRHNGKIGLHHAIVIVAIDFFANPLFD